MTETSGISKNEQEELAKFGLKRCSECGKIWPFEYFWKRSYDRSPDSHEKICRVCGKKRLRVRYERRFIQNLIEGCEKRAKKMNGPCEITEAFVMKTLEEQHWLCKYTKIPMTLDRLDNLFAVSVDRKNSNLSYIESNVVLCCQGVNFIKSNRRYEDLLDESRCVVMNALPLDNPYLLERPNEGLSAITSEKARNKRMDFEGVEFERVGNGISARLLPTYRPRGTWKNYCSPSICEWAHSSTISSADI